MADRKFVRPSKPGLRVINVQTNLPIPAEGQEVVWSSYYSRRVNEGALLIENEKKSSNSSKTKNKRGN